LQGFSDKNKMAQVKLRSGVDGPAADEVADSLNLTRLLRLDLAAQVEDESGTWKQFIIF
jgi:hypothetical protein